MRHRAAGTLKSVLAGITALLLVAVLSACGSGSGGGGGSNNNQTRSGY